MDKQERYDELDNIYSTLDVLIDEITDKYYIDMLSSLKYEALDEKEELEIELQRIYDKEEKEMNQEFERSRI